MVKVEYSFIHIPPHALNSLIMHTFTSNNCVSSRTTERMHKQVHGNVYIFTPFIDANARWKPIDGDGILEEPECSVCTIIIRTIQVNWKSGIPIHRSMNNKSPPIYINQKEITLLFTLSCKHREIYYTTTTHLLNPLVKVCHRLGVFPT